MIQNVLMLVGALVWLAGEVWGIVRDRQLHGGHTPDTTSGWVWLLESKWQFGRMVVAAGLAALAVHFLLH